MSTSPSPNLSDARATKPPQYMIIMGVICLLAAVSFLARTVNGELPTWGWAAAPLIGAARRSAPGCRFDRPPLQQPVARDGWASEEIRGVMVRGSRCGLEVERVSGMAEVSPA